MINCTVWPLIYMYMYTMDLYTALYLIKDDVYLLYRQGQCYMTCDCTARPRRYTIRSMVQCTWVLILYCYGTSQDHVIIEGLQIIMDTQSIQKNNLIFNFLSSTVHVSFYVASIMNIHYFLVKIKIYNIKKFFFNVYIVSLIIYPIYL